MIHLVNIFSLILAFIWNASILFGTIYLIDQHDWSKWTLVATLLFFASWRTLPEEKKEEEPPKIILDNNSNYNYEGLDGRNH
jgi:hypothetical protein